MKNSRNLDDLLPNVKLRVQSMLARCAADPWFVENGITVLVTSTLRDNESQTALYAQGRTTPGKVVTNAKAGYSWHNFACAVDVVPLRNGIAVWGTKGDGIDDNPADDKTDDMEVWQRIARHGKQAGLEWAGDWESFKEYAHFQYTGGLSMSELRAGKVPQ
ncbi:MAG: M15 family metallopeptidase [Pseudomonadota bacterium]